MANTIDSSIFRAYDIRGIVGETLTPDTLYLLGQGIGSIALEKGERCMTIACDGRLSGPSLKEALGKGILSTGCDVIDIGMVPTPLLYFATFSEQSRSGVMLTGSHNPPEYNGLKIVIQNQTLAEHGIQEIYQRIHQGNFHQGRGAFQSKDIVSDYIHAIQQDVHLKRPLKVVVDCGNGVPGMLAPDLIKKLGCEVIPLYCEVDGHFPNHHPDPSLLENLTDLIEAVKKNHADVGLAFDGDGDRLGVVTSEGEVIFPDRQLILFAQSVLDRHPGATIIYDVKCTNHLPRMIKEAGGHPILWKTGHSLIKAKLAETGALLAGEMSGHLFFKDRWYGFDDAIYSAVRLLEILAESSLGSAAIFHRIPDSVNTPELKIPVSEHEKFAVMEKIIQAAHFDEPAELITLDGLRVNFEHGWGLVRPSNTTPYLILRFEADTADALEKVQTAFRALLVSVNPHFVLPF